MFQQNMKYILLNQENMALKPVKFFEKIKAAHISMITAKDVMATNLSKITCIKEALDESIDEIKRCIQVILRIQVTSLRNIYQKCFSNKADNENKLELTA